MLLVDTNSLSPHPLNAKIYGEEIIDQSLLDDIKEKGILSPIIITEDNIIVSGHRRWVIAKELGLEKVPCDVVHFESDQDVELALISFNKTRVKTYIQEMLEIDEEKKIRERMGQPATSDHIAECRNMSKGMYHRKTFLWDAAKSGDEFAKNQVRSVAEGSVTVAKAYKKLLEHANEVKIREARKEAANLGKVLAESQELYLGRFQDVLDFVPDGTVDAIITDPPYPIEYIDCWLDLGKFASAKLRPGGWLVAYSGQKNLPHVFSRLAQSDLVYYWMFALYHNGTKQDVWGVDVNVCWKPILVYAKPPVMKLDNRGKDDYIVSEREEKMYHNWEQSTSGVANLIETFTQVDDLVVDPFAGSGTTLAVGKAMKRKVVGAEVDSDTYNIAKQKLNGFVVGSPEPIKAKSSLNDWM